MGITVSKKKILKILSEGPVEIIFKQRVPYLCFSANEDYEVGEKARIGDNCITLYNKVNQKLINKIKKAIIEVIKKNNKIT